MCDFFRRLDSQGHTRPEGSVMHKCASCEGFLVKRRTSHGWTYACKQCGGRSVALSVLRRAAGGVLYLSIPKSPSALAAG